MSEDKPSDADVARLDRLKEAKRLIEEVIDAVEAPAPGAITIDGAEVPAVGDPPEESTAETPAKAAPPEDRERGDWRQGRRFGVGAEEA